MLYIFEHTRLGFCWWDLLALIVLIAVIAAFVWKHHKIKDEQKDLEDQLSEIYAEEAVPLESES